MNSSDSVSKIHFKFQASPLTRPKSMKLDWKISNEFDWRTLCTAPCRLVPCHSTILHNWSIHRVRRFDVERTNQLGSTSLREILEDSQDHFRFLWAPSLPPNGWQPVTEQSGGNLPVNGSQKNRRRGKERITHEFSWPGDPLSCRFLFLVFSLRFISWRKERGNGLQNKEGEQNKTKIVLEKKTVVITRDMNKTQSDRWSVTRNHS